MSDQPSRTADLPAIHLASLYLSAANGGISAINQWDGGPVPRLHLCRGPSSVRWRLRADLPQDLIDRLTPLLAREQPAGVDPSPPDHHADYLRLLGPVSGLHAGPALAASEIRSPGTGAVPIDAANAEVLKSLMPDWLSDVPHRSPFFAALVDDAAVAVCASVRITDAAHQAGVEVHPSFRRQGHGHTAVAAWAAAVAALGARPLYSTTWDNVASRRLADSLGFTPFGSDYVLY